MNKKHYDDDTYRNHESGLSICYKHKHVCVQTVSVNPLVEVGCDINAGRVDEDNIVSQQKALVFGPENPHQLTLRELLLAQCVSQLTYRLKHNNNQLQVFIVTTEKCNIK